MNHTTLNCGVVRRKLTEGRQGWRLSLTEVTDEIGWRKRMAGAQE